LADGRFTAGQRVKLGGGVGPAENSPTLIVLMHGKKDFLNTHGKRRIEITPNRDQMARQTIGFSQHNDFGLFLIVERGEIVAAESPSFRLAREHKA
jgi:hypothetical protein